MGEDACSSVPRLPFRPDTAVVRAHLLQSIPIPFSMRTPSQRTTQPPPPSPFFPMGTTPHHPSPPRLPEPCRARKRRVGDTSTDLNSPNSVVFSNPRLIGRSSWRFHLSTLLIFVWCRSRKLSLALLHRCTARAFLFRTSFRREYHFDDAAPTWSLTKEVARPGFVYVCERSKAGPVGTP